MKQWVKQAEKKIPRWSERLRVINQQLWCCCRKDGIVVFDSELQQQRTLLAADTDEVCDVAEMSNGDVVLAARNGLYHIKNGECSLCHDPNTRNKILTAAHS